MADWIRILCYFFDWEYSEWLLFFNGKRSIPISRKLHCCIVAVQSSPLYTNTQRGVCMCVSMSVCVLGRRGSLWKEKEDPSLNQFDQMRLVYYIWTTALQMMVGWQGRIWVTCISLQQKLSLVTQNNTKLA